MHILQFRYTLYGKKFQDTLNISLKSFWLVYLSIMKKKIVLSNEIVHLKDLSSVELFLYFKQTAFHLGYFTPFKLNKSIPLAKKQNRKSIWQDRIFFNLEKGYLLSRLVFQLIN